MHTLFTTVVTVNAVSLLCCCCWHLQCHTHSVLPHPQCPSDNKDPPSTSRPTHPLAGVSNSNCTQIILGQEAKEVTVRTQIQTGASSG